MPKKASGAPPRSVQAAIGAKSTACSAWRWACKAYSSPSWSTHGHPTKAQNWRGQSSPWVMASTLSSRGRVGYCRSLLCASSWATGIRTMLARLTQNVFPFSHVTTIDSSCDKIRLDDRAIPEASLMRSSCLRWGCLVCALKGIYHRSARMSSCSSGGGVVFVTYRRRRGNAAPGVASGASLSSIGAAPPVFFLGPLAAFFPFAPFLSGRDCMNRPGVGA